MKQVINPNPASWPLLCKRPSLELEFLESTVRNILTRVKNSGDSALLELTLRYEKVKLEKLEVTTQEIAKAESELSPDLVKAILVAADNIHTFHKAQERKFDRIATTTGVQCWRKAVPVDRVGIYIPGGTAPLFSTVLMLAIPAKIAGCREIILCSPPDAQGNLSPAILYAAKTAGVTRMFKCGGAQAIAAMTYGTATIPTVDKIFGPGNQYVTKAKQLVSQEGVAIDLPAGPSEVLIIADATANPGYVAADLLSQAEHGRDSQVVLTTVDKSLAAKVQAEIETQLKDLPRKEIAKEALQNSLAITFNDQKEMMAFVNAYAPEHLIINTADAEADSALVRNAGSVFIGKWSPESVGDYASGTNHTLPTNGYARAYSGVSLESFQKYITFQMLTSEGLKNIGPSVEIMAEAEDLMAHKKSISIRLKDLK